MLSREIFRRIKVPEFVGQVVIDPNLCDGNGHLNNAKYLGLYEEQRGLYIAACGLSLREIAEKFGLTSMVRRYKGLFRKELFPKDKVDIYTGAQILDDHLFFQQRMIRDGAEAAIHWCTVWMVSIGDRSAQKIPEDLLQKIQNPDFLKA